MASVAPGTPRGAQVTKGVARKIRDALEDCLKAREKPSAKDFEPLDGYLANFAFRDAVYEAIMKRVREEKKNQRLVVLYGMRLSIRALNRYPPSRETLLRLQSFWIGYNEEKERWGIEKSCASVLHIISTHLADSAAPSADTAESACGGEATNGGGGADAAAAGGGGAGGGVEFDGGKGQGFRVDASVSTPPPLPSRNGQASPSDVMTEGKSFRIDANASKPATHGNVGDTVVCNFAALSGAPGWLPQEWDVSLQNSPAFGSQFKRVAGSKSLSFDMRDVLMVPNYSAPKTKQALRVIALERKRDEFAEYQKAGKLNRAPTHKLLNYKFYKDQTGLALTEEELREVVDTVVQGSRDEEYYRVCCKTLIKVLIDIYVADSWEGFADSVTVFLEMLQSTSADVRTSAFTLLFNLGIHCNLYDSSNAGLVASLHEQLFFRFLIPMLSQIFHAREEETRVWQASFNCFLFFISRDGGLVSTTRLAQLNARVIVAFLNKLPDVSEDARRFLLRLLVNSLYRRDTATNALVLDVALLHRACGSPQFVVEHFLNTRSQETRSNLFCVLFDYCVERLRRNERTSARAGDPAKVALVFELLKGAEAPHVLGRAARFLPHRFPEEASAFLVDQLARLDPHKSRQIDRELVQLVFAELSALIADFYKLDSEFQARFDALLAAGASGGGEGGGGNEKLEQEQEELAALLDLALRSSDERDRRNGENFLFQLMTAVIERRRIWDAQSLRRFVSRISKRLMHSSSARMRGAFYSITGRVMMCKLQSERMASDKLLQNVFQQLNTQFRLVRELPERDERNLLTVLDTFLDLCTILPTRTAPQQPFSSTASREPDLSWDLVVAGKSLIPYALLNHIDLHILLHLFSHLSSRRHAQPRVALGVLVMEKARRGDAILKTLPGVRLFYQFLGDRDPKIAFAASRYLLTFLKLQRPELFENYAKLLQRQAAKEKAERSALVLENAHVQLRVLQHVLGGLLK